TDAFERLSTIARKVLPHDIVVLPLGLPDGRHARIAARGGARAREFPDVVEIPESLVTGGKWEHEIVDDLQAHPQQRSLAAARLGYRSALRIPIRVESRFLGALVFFSAEAGAFTPADVPVARRIADRIVLVLARDQGDEASKRADEAAARA